MPSSAPCKTASVATRVRSHLKAIYPDADLERLAAKVLDIFSFAPEPDAVPSCLPKGKWSQEDILLITYGNSIVREDEKPLFTLRQFLNSQLKEQISMVHILPFFPYSSDDGFAVMNYYEVNHSLGIWEDITAISKDYRLMADLVINHTSSQTTWFENFKKGIDPGRGLLCHGRA